VVNRQTATSPLSTAVDLRRENFLAIGRNRLTSGHKARIVSPRKERSGETFFVLRHQNERIEVMCTGEVKE